MAPRTGACARLPPTSLRRYFKLLDLQPHRSESFKLWTRQFFIENCAIWWAFI
jgi:hypothetical protein